MSRATHLKIKLKTLAAEARIIRKEERKALEDGRRAMNRERETGATPSPRSSHLAFEDYLSLRDHRTGIVRDVARINNLAYGFLRGHSYAEMEAKTRKAVDLKAVKKLADRFGSPKDHARWADWQTEATQHLDSQKVSVNLPPSPVVAKEVA